VTFTGGALSGTPTVTGTFPITLTAHNGILADAIQNFTLTVAVPAPVVTGIAPAVGPITGGTPVTITGTNLASATAVDFGSTPGTITSDSATAITATSPIGSGTVDVTVITAGGTSATSGADQFTYGGAPTVTGVTPSSLGQGATKFPVTITGTGFVSGATVTVSGKGATLSSVVVVNSTTITAAETVGATAAVGARNVTVNEAGLGSVTCHACQAITAGPKVTGISPSSVARGSHTSVTITGSGFVAGLTVKGPTGVSFSSVTVVSSTSITATLKVGATAVPGTGLSITVTNSAGAGSGRGIGKVLTIT
jgi:hypothetical protein